MKKLTVWVTFLLLAHSVVGQANTKNEVPEGAKEVLVGFNDAFVPGGFDSQSDVYVIANGLFPNGCYKYQRSEIIHKENFVHEVRAYATVSQGMCIMVLVPFTKEIHLGQIGSGKHVVRFISGDGTYMEKRISIE